MTRLSTTRTRPCRYAIGALLVACSALLALPRATAAAEPAARVRLALLIGVNKYPHLRRRMQLKGCENDVVAMRSLLLERFEFAPDDIVTLVDEQATGDGIRREFAALIAKLAALPQQSLPPVVVVHFSGHGSQIEDQPPEHEGFDELDGLDETIVPHDATRQGGQQDIRDDELYALIEQACALQETKLWMVLDCCHSGTGARGATKIRKLDRGSLHPTPPAADSLPPPRRLPPGAVILSACQPQEVEPEYQSEGQVHGLLTSRLVEVIHQNAALSQLSYDLLHDAIVTSYRSDYLMLRPPTPMLEFGDPQSLRESIVDGAGLDRPPLWAISRDPGRSNRVIMHAGTLHGVTAGSLFEAYETVDAVQWELDPTAERNGESLCWLQVEDVAGGSATCRAFRWQGEQRSPAYLPSDWLQGYAVLRRHEHGDARLRVRVVRAANADEDGPPLAPGDAVPPPILDVLSPHDARPDSNWLDWVHGDGDFDFLLRIDGDDAAVFPAAGAASVPPSSAAPRDDSPPPALRGGWGPIDLRDPDAARTNLRDMLRRIARARNLIAIASRGRRQPGAGDGPQLNVQLQLLQVEETDEHYNVAKWRPWPPHNEPGASSNRLIMRTGDSFAFRVVNAEPAGNPIYVTVLQVDGNMTIDQIHPWQPAAGAPAEGEQRLEAGQALIPPGYFVCNGETGEPPLYGRRWAIVLATRAANNFHLLAQEGLPVTRGTTSPLEELLREQVDLQGRSGASRGSRSLSQYDHSWGAMVIEWDVLPE
ncbi:MAG: caspase [Planctomycetaceae bacterium]|nr:caspase [Planctomycetaceae bacterium]